jgi:uncharacterized membrane protein (TIGR02234 family)
VSPEQTTDQPTEQPAMADAPDTPVAAGAASEQPLAAARSWRRPLSVTLLLSVAGATLLLVAAGQTWVFGKVQAQGAVRTVTAHGSELSGVPGAMALVALASVVAVFAVRGMARRTLGGLVVLAGAAAAGAAGTGALGSDNGALDEKAARSVGLTDVTATSLTHTAWPWLALIGGVLVLAAGVLTMQRSADWPGMSARYEAPAGKGSAAGPRRKAAAPAPAAHQTPADLWKALDRGEDPTSS